MEYLVRVDTLHGPIQASIKHFGNAKAAARRMGSIPGTIITGPNGRRWCLEERDVNRVWREIDPAAQEGPSGAKTG